MLKKYLTLLLCIQIVHANTLQNKKIVLVQAKDVNVTIFKGVLKTIPQTVAYSAAQVQESVLEEQILKLTDLTLDAQKQYLHGNLDTAKQSYVLISNLADKADWDSSERKSIFHSKLRLAQMTDNLAEKSDHIRNAIRFDFELHPDPKLFPPPIIDLFNQIHMEESKNAKLWDVNSVANHIESVRINGKRYATGNGGRIPIYNGQNRVTFISNKFKSITRQMNAQQILSVSFPDLSIASGTCENPKIENANQWPSNYAIVYRDDCIVQKRNGQFVSLFPSQLIKNEDIKLVQTEDSVKYSLTLPEPEKPSNKPSTLTLVGVAAGIALAVFAFSNRSSETVVQPTHD